MAASFFVAQGETCPAGSIHVNVSEAEANKEAICDELGDWYISRLGGNAGIYGKGYGCKVETNQSQTMGESVCKIVHKVNGGTCPSGTEHVTYEEANDSHHGSQSNLCDMLETWEISRLSAQASMDGSGYGCSSSGYDLRTLGSSLCKTKLDSDGGSDGLDGRNQKKVAYVEVNSNDFGNIACYQEDNEPLFDVAVIFAANINFDADTRKASLHFNQQVSELLNNQLHKVRAVQDQGTKVILDVLGNHQNAGWSCFANEQQANDFAQVLKDAVDQYGLDGIDIDDEYSKCDNTYGDSLAMVTRVIKGKMPDKLITKALFRDIHDFENNWQGHKLGDNLDYGWEMSYWGNSCESRLAPYVEAGVSKTKLGVGASTVSTPSATAKELAKCAMDRGYTGGMMIFNVSKDSTGYLQSIWRGVSSKPNCLK
ncbi:glycosyl hydrolase family 18 protein [Shewanella submarina]|uniref:Glycosyl hydrolase family 18 protein n=1 Tax=Shewanella submarina TaxID=2016376 RepID=A0ABV7G8E3_9GAMM|nr:glycosyl hydrolase family 18 protein [Shewanella submarina]MCL1036819.1 glycosyl hydrolase family 18 protein [Shewanella submarina]